MRCKAEAEGRGVNYMQSRGEAQIKCKVGRGNKAGGGMNRGLLQFCGEISKDQACNSATL